MQDIDSDEHFLFDRTLSIESLEATWNARSKYWYSNEEWRTIDLNGLSVFVDLDYQRLTMCHSKTDVWSKLWSFNHNLSRNTELSNMFTGTDCINIFASWINK